MEVTILIIGFIFGFVYCKWNTKRAYKNQIKKINQVQPIKILTGPSMSIDDVCQSLVLAFNGVMQEGVENGKWYRKEDLFRIRRKAEVMFPGLEIRYQFKEQPGVNVNVSYKDATRTITIDRVV